MANYPALDALPSALLDMLAGHRVTAVIYVAASLGIPDELAEGPRTSADLAKRVSAHEPSVRRLLRALVTLGLCTESKEHSFELTALGRYLPGSARQSLKPFVLFEGQFLRLTWGALIDSIQTGKTAPELAGVNVEKNWNLQAAGAGMPVLFNEAMVAITQFVAPLVASAYDFSRIEKLIDVGGGHGELLGVILNAHPSLRGAIFDLPLCAEGARRHLAEAGVSARCEFVAGNFFESVPPGADALIMKSVIHDWDDERSTKILSNCRRALGPTGKLLLVERIMPEELEARADHRATALSDLNMLRGPGGAERTEREFRDVLAKGGFTLTRVIPAGPMDVIEAACA
jgi:SAM-dependent methyltransferase